MAMQGTQRSAGVVSLAGRRDRRDGGWLARRPGEGGFDPQRVGTALGWFSVGLGVAELLAPVPLLRAIGLKGRAPSPLVTRMAGVRELGAGVGILTEPRPARWMWSRVFGDVMDLALLGAGFAARRANRKRLAVATAAVVGVTALDALCAQRLTAMTRVSAGSPDARSVRARKRITLDRPADALYRFWRDFTNHPKFMERVETVQVTGERRSHWRARGPAGTTVEWDSEVTEERPNELIAWRTLPGASIEHTGSVRFEPAPGGRGTVVTVEMQYSPPGGAITAAAAKMLGYAPEQQLQEDLRRFKQLMETGEVVVSEAGTQGGAR